MPSISSWLSDLSRRKLNIAATSRDGLRDTINLRRFVLLKNSITQAESLTPSPTPTQPPHSPDDHSDAFVIPATDALNSPYNHHDNVGPGHDSEEKWFESVLETLGDDFDTEIEVEVHPVEDDDLDFFELESEDSYESWVPPYNGFAIDAPLPLSTNEFLSPTSVLPSRFQSSASLHHLFNSPNSHFNQPFVEPRYPEADFDLPTSETSSDGESDDDDDGPLTPYSGSQPSLQEQGTVNPEVYVDHDSYFLYPSELDLITPQPIYYQQC